MFDGKLENSELKGCTKLEKIEYIKEMNILMRQSRLSSLD